MKIARYISDLLYEHECVVIPGLGGFISKDHGAQIHPLKHQFKPPYREIVFNPHLRANDGLLLSLIARSENLPYQDAKLNLDRFVHKCIDGLNKGHKINFRNVGSIALDIEKQIVFYPDENQNFMASSFGLSSFVSPAITREGLPEILENRIFRKNHETPVVPEAPQKVLPTNKQKRPQLSVKPPMVASKRPSPYKRQLMFIGALVLMMGVGWSYMNKHIVQRYYNAYAGLVPFFYSSPNDYIVLHSEKFPIEQIMPKVKVINSLDGSFQKKQPTVENNLEPASMLLPAIQDAVYQPDTASIVDTSTQSSLIANTVAAQVIEETSPIVESKPEPEIVVTKPQGTQYLIIAGAFREKANADNLVHALRAKGYTADYAGQNNRGLWMVSVERFDMLSEARERLITIRREENADYWILKV